ncbi:AtpZ/AtpI family protein [Pedobacter sp. SYP-B3415]|uniref:AtpZ/AtpI family protein n=1 Tax=Pedobacter sp. SYP-B3415 TaxID=2496641 RepID=UPI00101B84B0|nr:AtpZ/AtpI family protein [Pedobacter sp. SYP-B3415]
MEPKREEKDVNTFLKYSAVGFQLLAVIGVFTFIGYQIDKTRPGKTPVFTALFGLLGVCGGLVQTVRQLTKKGK